MFSKRHTGIYFHWPFCKSRCPYCDFNTYICSSDNQDFDEREWLNAYIRVIDYYAQKLSGKQVVSIFFGGGTPSLMNPDFVARLIEHVCRSWNTASEGVEITLEANPTSVESAKMQDFAQAGVNRLSLGVQSLRSDGLALLGREHSVMEALCALESVRDNFARYSFDLIYARPGQSLEEWGEELEQALDLGASHMSVYQLAIARGTPFFRRFEQCEEERSALFYNFTQEIMAGAGLEAYEVSNHARKGEECRHNMLYWRMGDYIGIGAGAHGRYSLGGKRYATCDERKPQSWIGGVLGINKGWMQERELSIEEQRYEALLTGLRLYEGLELEAVREILDFGKINSAVKEGWLVCDGVKLRATGEGMLRLDSLLAYILI